MSVNSADLLSIPPTGVMLYLEKLAENIEKDEYSSLALLETSNAFVQLLPNQDFADLCGNRLAPDQSKFSQELHLKPCRLLLTSKLHIRIEVMRFVVSILVGMVPKLQIFDLDS